MSETYRRSATAGNECPECGNVGYMGIFKKDQFGVEYICPNCSHIDDSDEF